MKYLELLAPARNLECGIAAIDHGADAVYIGPERYGARIAAGNSIDDIRRLCEYAHQYAVKVYATVNTLFHDDELADVERLMWQLYEAGVDAVLIQDMRVLDMNLPPIALHASTQADNRTASKVRLQYQRGMRRVVLARELSIDEIAAIHESVPEAELEVFVHGALCVSYSGCCYASEYCFGRSANRGACAQFCRLPFDLLDADGQVLEHDRYLLSLKDLNQIDYLQQLIDAGATSLKIEGRLKDVVYVKNVTAAYSERLNDIIRRNPDRYCRASLGRCTYTFKPDLNRTFNRGFTHYFLKGRQPDIFSPATPKAMGEYVGKVKEIRGNSFTVAGTARFSNGDGLCYFEVIRPTPTTHHLTPNTQHPNLKGFRVNRVEGNRLFPQKMPDTLRPGMALYRNNDIEFERLLSRTSAERKIPVTMCFNAVAHEEQVELDVSTGSIKVTVSIPAKIETARTSQREVIIRELSKLGNTPFACTDVTDKNNSLDTCFVPASKLSELRRNAVEKLKEEIRPQQTNFDMSVSVRTSISSTSSQGEVGGELPLMQCRHCLRYSLGYCVRRGGRRPSWKEPLQLRLGDGRLFSLEFDCKNCQMNVYAYTNDK